MEVWVPYLILCGGPAVVPGALTGLALHVRRRGGAGGVPAAYEEAFRATGHAAYQKIRAEAERKTPADSPGGPFRRTR
ncbi:hypothetical protein ACF06D_24640 [Streptomyces griseoluteus]|uniref:hypothetical protein n=1 Tax=Streptomyces griseoluteus TaxID=29306 RepID=UPI00370263E1